MMQNGEWKKFLLIPILLLLIPVIGIVALILAAVSLCVFGIIYYVTRARLRFAMRSEMPPAEEGVSPIIEGEFQEVASEKIPEQPPR